MPRSDNPLVWCCGACGVCLIVTVITAAILTPSIYGIVVTSNSISNYPVGGAERWETCNGGYYLRVFIIGALVSFCSGDLVPIFPIVWAFIGHNWLSKASDCEIHDHALYEAAHTSWILICVGCVMGLAIWVVACGAVCGIWSCALCCSRDKFST
ncbi:1968_t:CDS:1 [Ambispora leptoticha]|uniref:1968_t:CDS:1 n=1 Tax=Ambispora leptoticha TaxID=144679 RepID=A0A9N8YSQ4_9GLOM|nr:1968_t:CDS:1 [Ambispora leptoticha]